MLAGMCPAIRPPTRLTGLKGLSGLAGLAASLAALAGCSGAPDWNVAIIPVPAPTSMVSFSPQLTSQGDRLLLSWLELAELQYILKFSERTAAGWSEPRAVIAGDTLVSNAADVPSVRALSDGTLVAHWLQRGGANPEAYDSPLSWSRDGGRTWTPPVTPHHDGTKTQHGFTSIFERPGGGVGVVWLDGRNTDSTLPEGQNGDMALWSAAFDAAGNQTAEAPIDRRVCECCQTSAAVAGDAAVVAYRERTPEEVRDIHLVRLSGDAWNAPVPVHADAWTINGCPVNGPAVDARGNTIAVGWFTGAGGEAQTYLAFSADGGRTFADRIRIDEGGSTGHLDVAILSDEAAVASWTAVVDRRAYLFVRRVDRSGARSRAVRVADVIGTHYPRMAYARSELVFAWTEMVDGFSHIRTASAAVP
jgi:hypothetical protein